MKSVRRLENCVRSGLTCAVFDALNGWLVTGEQDGSFRVWSQEGRCLDTFAGISDMVRTGLAGTGSAGCHSPPSSPAPR